MYRRPALRNFSTRLDQASCTPSTQPCSAAVPGGGNQAQVEYEYLIETGVVNVGATQSSLLNGAIYLCYPNPAQYMAE